MTEKKPVKQSGARQQWEYEQIDTAQLAGRQIDYQERLKALGEDGWEAYAVVSFGGSGMRFFLKRPVTIDPPPDGGRVAARPAPIDPPPDGG